MGLTPGAFNSLVFISLLENYRGTIRNLLFVLAFWLLSIYFGSYLFAQADMYYSDNQTEPNPLFAYFLASILLADFVASIIKVKALKYAVYRYKDIFLDKMGLMKILDSLMIATSVLCYIVPSIWILTIILHALPPGSYLFPITLIIGIAKWGIIAYHCMFMTPNVADQWDDAPKPPPKVLDHLADIILTITSTILFTVIWQVGLTHFIAEHHPYNFQLNMPETIGRGVLYTLSLPFFCMFLYAPTRLIFIMEDYYSIISPKHRRAAFLSSVFAIAVSVAIAIYKTY